jgi:hypothetical protein
MTEPIAPGFPRWFLLKFALWSFGAFVAAWMLHPVWERVIGGIGARLAAGPGQEIEMMDLELFYPFDIGIFVGLCLASTWAPLERRGRAIAIGLLPLIVVEIIALVVSIKAMILVKDPAEGERFFDSMVRVSSIVAALVAWLMLLGHEKLSLSAMARRLEPRR